ncbi:MAG: hypothetical protein WHU95_02550 [candidate division WOR-3 bacterium]|nr:hypothetical protein [candidate division WOR-3 bacterium]MDH7518567.1 hypothetical protein [bacterium]
MLHSLLVLKIGGLRKEGYHYPFWEGGIMSEDKRTPDGRLKERS